MSRSTEKQNVDYTTNAIIHTVGFVVTGDRNKDYNRALKKLYELENLLEKYNVENVEELEKILKIFFMKE